MREKAPRSVQQHISTQQVGAETLVYDELRHMAFCLNATSSAVWRLADGRRSIAQIATASSLELCAMVSEELVCYAVEELRRDGLMEAASSRCEDCAGDSPRRAMLQRLGVGGAHAAAGGGRRLSHPPRHEAALGGVRRTAPVVSPSRGKARRQKSSSPARQRAKPISGRKNE